MPKNLVIVGGGPAATNALETIRQFDPSANVTVICDEPAHSRMALPYWLSGQIPEAQTHTGDDDYFQRLRAEARIGQRVVKLDEQQRALTLDTGDTVPFDDLLLATGSKPIALPIPGADLPGVQHLWTLRDTSSVLQTTENLKSPRVVMIGAGFIGLIVLNAMYKRGWKLTVVERESQILPRMLNGAAAELAENWLSGKQVDVHCGINVQAIESDATGAKQVVLEDGTSIGADIVIVATGVTPNLDLVAGTSIATDYGILVNDQMETNVPRIFAAGDVAQGPVRFSQQREVHAIQSTAVDHGRVAGANMADQAVHYPGSLSMNVLDVCGLQCASFGQWQAADAEAFTMVNPQESIYRSLVWSDDQIIGAIFAGRANDLGMLTDVGMVKGMIQTGTRFGPWKEFLQQNPFDIRRAFIACDIPKSLMNETLLGQPAAARQFRYGEQPPRQHPSAAHQVYTKTKA